MFTLESTLLESNQNDQNNIVFEIPADIGTITSLNICYKCSGQPFTSIELYGDSKKLVDMSRDIIELHLAMGFIKSYEDAEQIIEPIMFCTGYRDPVLDEYSDGIEQTREFLNMVRGRFQSIKLVLTNSQMTTATLYLTWGRICDKT